MEKTKLRGFSNSTSFSEDKFNTLFGLVCNAIHHGMICVILGMMPSANRPEELDRIAGSGPDAHNRVGSFIGPRAASFQVIPTDAPAQSDLQTAELYGRRIAEITRQFVKGR